MPASIDALKADREAVLEICERLDDAGWALPSGCSGWSVQDVIGHMAALYWMVVDLTALPDTAGLPTEEAQEVLVASRREWDPGRVLEDYRKVSEQAIDNLSGMAGADFEIPLGDLGTYPAHLIANAYAFDHFTHIRADLFPPRGPLTGSAPPADAVRADAAIDWIEAALPQQNAALVGQLPAAIELIVDGPVARRITVGSGPPSASVRSDAMAFVRWTTQRGSWEDLGVEAKGDELSLATARAFHVI